jgi:hypothetical protein
MARKCLSDEEIRIIMEQIEDEDIDQGFPTWGTFGHLRGYMGAINLIVKCLKPIVKVKFNEILNFIA